MKVSSENYQNPLSVNSDIDQAASSDKTDKAADNPQNSNTPSSKDTVEISGQAAKLARAELREQAALIRIQFLKEQTAATTQSGAEAEDGEAVPEDPLTRFINTILKMMEERQEIQLENAADQAERQKSEVAAAMQELQDARAEKKAAQEEGATETASAGISPGGRSKASASKATADNVGQKGREQSAATYGKKGSPIGAGSVHTANKSNCLATV